MSTNTRTKRAGKKTTAAKTAGKRVRENLDELRKQNADYLGQIAAINQSQAVIEFQMDGTILTANERFLRVMGYALEEIQGRHHSLFVDEAFKASAEYKQFWERLNRGEFQSAEYKRLGKNGKEVWIQATYTPTFDLDGNPLKVIKYATDVTEQKFRNVDYAGQIAAINKSQAVIEFNMDGTILTANENFLAVVGYSLGEVQGQHHSLFVDDDFRHSTEYRTFWEGLNRGEFQSAEYKRLGKNGKEVWIQATYNPILDIDRRPFKVVKYAIDITERVELEQQQRHCNDIMSELVEAANAGDLSRRGDIARLSGGFAELVTGINSILENVSGVLERTEQTSSNLAIAAEEFKATSGQMRTNAENTADQATIVAAASEEVSKNMEIVASAIEELNVSIEGISESALSAAQVGSEAMKVAEDTNSTVSRLSQSSTEIGNVVKVITSIAEQTNLLALNATIEAARAGEAGKGFAVVANEVKELAKQTATATEEIGQKIATIQNNTEGAVQAIGEIGGIIGNINSIQTTIASAVEEQAATVGEIGRTTTEASHGTGEISRNISSVDTLAKQTLVGSRNGLEGATELAQMAGELGSLLGQFKLRTKP